MGATNTIPRLKPGSVVRCRTRRYLVEDVQPPMHRKVPDGGDRVVTLACMEDDAIGQRLTVFLGSEVDFEQLPESSWEAVIRRGFDEPRQFSAYLNTLRWNCVTATDAELFQAPYRAGIDVKAYQLEPLRKALLMPRVGLFIADDVGLGKTIEAGLILREMLLRQRIRRVVISCPPSVLRQWQEEMAQRFGLAFTVMDRAYVAKVRQERGYGTNPWSTGSRFLISHALLRNPDDATPLISWLDQGRGDEEQAPLPSLLILDEAHNAAPASNSLHYAIDSGLTRSLRDLAPRFEHRLFLSATPHNGHSNSFTALLELLDPARFTRGVAFDPADLEVVLVRRLKDDLRIALNEAFPERIVEPLRIPKGSLPPDTPELELSRLLQRYRKQREARLLAEGAGKRAINADRLVITNLPLPPDESLRLRHAAYQRSTRSSTRIEGNPLDDEGVRQAVAAADREGSKAEQEVRNYWRALDRVEEWAQGSGPLSEAWIQKLHAVVIVRGRGRRRQRTPFRDHEVPVVDTLSRRIDYAPPRPEDVGSLMQQLCAWWQASEGLPPLVRAALLSHRFISIHPFADGNGRCGRLLATTSLWRSGYAFRGFLSFEEWFAADREAYYAALQLGCPVDFYEGRHDPDHSPWLEYFAAVMQRAASDLAERAQALQARQEPPEPHPWEGLDRRSQQLLTRLRALVAAGQESADQFKPTDLEEWFAVSSTTAQDWLHQWQEQGLLEPARPGQRIRSWRLREPWQEWVLGQPLQRE